MLTTHRNRFPSAPSFRPLTCSALALGLALSHIAQAGPSGGNVTGGTGSVTSEAATTTIIQESERLSIDWESFDVAFDERVNFIQPDADSVALNRILSHDPSQILGQIDANGRIILANPNGIIFGDGATLNVGGIVASGLQIDASDFMNGDWIFAGVDATGGLVVNRGLINAAIGGDIVLLGKQVRNEGLISAELGSIHLAAAEAAVLTFDAEGMLGVRITEETLRDELGMESAVSNAGELRAAAGKVLLTSRASQDIFSDAVNHNQPSGELGVTVHDDGSFSLSRAADMVNTGVIDVSFEDEGISLQSEGVEIRGRDIEHSGTISMGQSGNDAIGWHEPTNVEIRASDTVKLQDGAITSTPAFGNTVVIEGLYISLDGESMIDIGPGEIRIGDIESSDRVFLGENARLISSARYHPGFTENYFGDGGNITLRSRLGTAVNGTISARGTASNTYSGESQGGAVVLESQGTLGFQGDVDVNAGAGDGLAGELTLTGRNLILSDEPGADKINSASLNLAMFHAHVNLNATEKVSVQDELPTALRLFYDFSVTAPGTEEQSGHIQLKSLRLDTNASPLIGSPPLNITMEAGSIDAPEIRTESVSQSQYHRTYVDLVAHNGNILHDRPIDILAGNYSAVAAKDIIFTQNAVLNSGTLYEPSGQLHLESGRKIWLRLVTNMTNENNLLQTPIILQAPSVDVWGTGGVDIIGDVHAHDFNMQAHGNIDINAEISGRTKLRANQSSEIVLTGDLNLLDLELSDSSLTINDRNDLSFVNVLSAYDSEVSVYASALRTIEGSEEGDYLAGIDIRRSQFNAEADQIDFRHGFSVSGELASANTSFTESLTLPHSVSSSGQNTEIHFYGPEDRGAYINVVNDPNVRGSRSAVGGIHLSTGGNTIDLAGNLSLPINLSDGADTINELAPDLTYTLNNFDASRDTLNPFEPIIDPEPERPWYSPPDPQTAPTGGIVTGGDGTISYTDNTTTIQQESDQLALDWDSFNLSVDQRVEFVQPGQQSIALNNILSHDASQIFGQIDANGRIILANPNGLVFGEESSLNVGGLVASGLHLDPADFMEEHFTFAHMNDSDGRVFNYGAINAATADNLSLIGTRVSNAGTLLAPQGSINLVAANELLLWQGTEGRLESTIVEDAFGNAPIDEALITNSGELVATAGRIKLASRNRQDLVDDRALGEREPVTLDENGNFTFDATPDIINTGTIDTSFFDPLAWEAEPGLVEIIGNNIAHRGAINIGILVDPENEWADWIEYLETDVIIHGSDRVMMDSGSVFSLPSRGNSVQLHGKYVRLTDEASIDIGPGSIEVGTPQSTDAVYTAHDTTLVNAATFRQDYPYYVGDGGNITFAAEQSVVVNSDIQVRGYASDGYTGESTGGTVVLESGGLLGFDGIANISAGSGHGTAGQLHLRAPNLNISDSGLYSLTSSALGSALDSGVVTLDAGFDIRSDSDTPIILVPNFDLNFLAGRANNASGIIDLGNLIIDHGKDYYYMEPYLDISFAADSIIAPQLGTELEKWHEQFYRTASVFLTARDGDIVHNTDVFTYGGTYSATATGDIVFASNARLLTNFRSLTGGDIQLHSGGNIDLRYAADAWFTEWRDTYSYTPVNLIGQNVKVRADDAYLTLDVQADQFELIGAGPIDINANISGTTALRMGAGSNWNLTGDYNLLTADMTHSTLNVSDLNDLILGDITARENSLVGLIAGSGGRIEQNPNSTIQLQRAQLEMSAYHLHLGADGSAALITSNDENNAVTGDFNQSLTLNGTLLIGSEYNAVVFNNTGEIDSSLTVGEQAQVHSFDPGTADIRMNNGNNSINLAANMPIPIALGVGADVINLQAPELQYELLYFDNTLDRVNPFVAPDPEPNPEPDEPGFRPPFWGWPIWGRPVWGLPMWKPHPGIFWFGHPAFHHYPKPKTHYSPWLARHH